MNNREIIETYYRAHKSELLAFVSTRLHDSIEAEDLVQEAFLRLLTGERPISEVTLPNLAYTLCHHLVIDWYRRHSVRTDVEHELKRSNKTADDADWLLSMHEMTCRIEHTLARLSDDSAKLYRLHIYDGMKTAEISQLTGQPYRIVEYRLGQARKEVRKQLRNIS
ncbi:MAG: sigma-70 family RNA polymerase sigma factor [Prevotella sp.]|nr:sigma-70 family RNA polymerase sigma factor [Prevotella sp.]